MSTTTRSLIDLYSGEVLRLATEAEAEASDAAAAADGGVGAIEADGLTCWVEAE